MKQIGTGPSSIIPCPLCHRSVAVRTELWAAPETPFDIQIVSVFNHHCPSPADAPIEIAA